MLDEEILLNVGERAIESKVFASWVRAWLYLAIQEREKWAVFRRPTLTLQEGSVPRDKLLIPSGELVDLVGPGVELGALILEVIDKLLKLLPGHLGDLCNVRLGVLGRVNDYGIVAWKKPSRSVVGYGNRQGRLKRKHGSCERKEFSGAHFGRNELKSLYVQGSGMEYKE